MPAFVIPESAQSFVAGNVASATDRDGTPQVSLDGVPLWEVRVVALPEAETGRQRVPLPEVLRVQVPASQMPDLAFGQPVVFAELVMRTWAARDGRQGVMYSASAVKTRNAAAKETVPSVPSAGGSR